jgi:hypothetical protein
VGSPKENTGLLITFYSLVVLMDLGLDPASKQARKALDRVNKHLNFKWRSYRRFFDGETEPCINGRILALGAYFKEPWNVTGASCSAVGVGRGGLVEAIPTDQGPISTSATKAVSPLLGVASYRRAVKHLLTRVVREICTRRSGGAGERATAQWALSDERPYRDS